MTVEKQKPRPWMHYMALGSTISATLAGLAVGAFFLGSFLDRRLGTTPVFTLVCIFLGVILGLSYMIVTLLREFGGGNGRERGGDE
jgi:F0F1-type ATP synthase assembly protein I